MFLSKDEFTRPKKFNIQELNINGDGRTSFLIKRKFNDFPNEDSDNNIKILVELDKSSDIEEKIFKIKSQNIKFLYLLM